MKVITNGLSLPFHDPVTPLYVRDSGKTQPLSLGEDHAIYPDFSYFNLICSNGLLTHRQGDGAG
ncbi:MAG: hypothetical protein L3J49_11620 [Desulfobulbaceae bacterium]|nr:hypothetical protein [Desulfobulbaceae bacterium]